MLILSGGQEISINAMEITKEPLDSISQRLALERGAQTTDHHAWRFPVKQWRFKERGGKQLVMTVIDQGRHRVFWNRIERK